MVAPNLMLLALRKSSGLNCLLALFLPADGPLTNQDVMALTGLSAPAVRAGLRKLAELGLAEAEGRTHKSGWRVTPLAEEIMEDVLAARGGWADSVDDATSEDEIEFFGPLVVVSRAQMARWVAVTLTGWREARVLRRRLALVRSRAAFRRAMSQVTPEQIAGYYAAITALGAGVPPPTPARTAPNATQPGGEKIPTETPAPADRVPGRCHPARHYGQRAVLAGGAWRLRECVAARGPAAERPSLVKLGTMPTGTQTEEINAHRDRGPLGHSAVVDPAGANASCIHPPSGEIIATHPRAASPGRPPAHGARGQAPRRGPRNTKYQPSVKNTVAGVAAARAVGWLLRPPLSRRPRVAIVSPPPAPISVAATPTLELTPVPQLALDLLGARTAENRSESAAAAPAPASGAALPYKDWRRNSHDRRAHVQAMWAKNELLARKQRDQRDQPSGLPVLKTHQVGRDTATETELHSAACMSGGPPDPAPAQPQESRQGREESSGGALQGDAKVSWQLGDGGHCC